MIILKSVNVKKKRIEIRFIKDNKKCFVSVNIDKLIKEHESDSSFYLQNEVGLYFCGFHQDEEIFHKDLDKASVFGLEEACEINSTLKTYCFIREL